MGESVSAVFPSLCQVLVCSVVSTVIEDIIQRIHV